MNLYSLKKNHNRGFILLNAYTVPVLNLVMYDVANPFPVKSFILLAWIITVYVTPFARFLVGFMTQYAASYGFGE